MPKSNGVVNPFSEKFLETWGLWKQYRWESHKFKYKGLISEQMALKQLVGLSDGDEQKAVAIIEQSIRREWQGLFPLHETRHSNEQRNSKTTAGQPKQSLREQAANEFNNRNAKREQSTDSDYLKAV